jgi:hypothetical protein
MKVPKYRFHKNRNKKGIALTNKQHSVLIAPYIRQNSCPANLSTIFIAEK